MFCKYCGKPMYGKSCLYCGSKIEVVKQAVAVDFVKETSSMNISKSENEGEINLPIQEAISSKTEGSSVAANPTYGMKWFKFLIYFALPAGAVLNLFMVIMALTGNMFVFNYIPAGDFYRMVLLEVKDSMDSEQWAFMCFSFGLMMMCPSILGIEACFFLAKFKKNGPKVLYLSYVFNLLYSIGIPFLMSKLILHKNFFRIPDILSISVSVVMLIVNIKYFSTRRDMFTK